MREGNQQFTPEHLLKVLLDDDEGLAADLIDRAGGDRARPGGVEAALDKLPKGQGGGAGQVYLAGAARCSPTPRIAEKAGDSFVTAERLLLAMALETAAKPRILAMPASPRRTSTARSRRCARAAPPTPPRPRKAMTR